VNGEIFSKKNYVFLLEKVDDDIFIQPQPSIPQNSFELPFPPIAGISSGNEKLPHPRPPTLSFDNHNTTKVNDDKSNHEIGPKETVTDSRMRDCYIDLGPRIDVEQFKETMNTKSNDSANIMIEKVQNLKENISIDIMDYICNKLKNEAMKRNMCGFIAPSTFHEFDFENENSPIDQYLH
jgi:hypothetical protein